MPPPLPNPARKWSADAIGLTKMMERTAPSFPIATASRPNMLTTGPFFKFERLATPQMTGEPLGQVTPKGKAGSERHQRRDDPALLGTKDAPCARGGSAVHRLHPDSSRFERANKGSRRLAQATARAKQEEFGRTVEIEQVAQRFERQAFDRGRTSPGKCADGTK